MRPSTRYIPTTSTEVTAPDVGAVVYTFTNFSGQLCALGYHGKAIKPDFHYAYASEERRQKSIESYFEMQRQRYAEKAKRQAERKNYRHTLKVGDILDYTWGYDQTNAEFFQVVSTTRQTATIHQIASHTETTGFMSGYATPIPDRFLPNEKPMLKRVQPVNYISMDFGSADLWDGRPVRCSWYA